MIPRTYKSTTSYPQSYPPRRTLKYHHLTPHFRTPYMAVVCTPRTNTVRSPCTTTAIQPLRDVCVRILRTTLAKPLNLPLLHASAPSAAGHSRNANYSQTLAVLNITARHSPPSAHSPLGVPPPCPSTKGVRVFFTARERFAAPLGRTKQGPSFRVSTIGENRITSRENRVSAIYKG
ncbi:hypothetical protein BU23DRAFT_131608 [Bimuria novae-zelandiae CBS 107.79]|uniref:Uncharacterized protein n=1 Tax=Bimuria novae-zelandiae CBS 107.79 TaxID=1447943 RepID=A0A6A5VBV9_9PLEO|nr:hypothetical protein BU23DRAFT_131608 [Bimuria novae-zelandiae CBS 107.79]